MGGASYMVRIKNEEASANHSSFSYLQTSSTLSSVFSGQLSTHLMQLKSIPLHTEHGTDKSSEGPNEMQDVSSNFIGFSGQLHTRT